MSFRDEYDAIWGPNSPPEDGELLDGIGLSPRDADYSEVFDEAGDEVVCPNCGNPIMWRESDGVYVCPECDTELSRGQFFAYIGAEPPGPKCLTCGNLFPGCVICPHGYV